MELREETLQQIEELEIQIRQLDEKASLGKSESRRRSRQLKKKQELENRLLFLDEQNKKDLRFMKEALKQAKKAAKLGEAPIGCVIVRDDEILASGYNRRNTDHSTLAHAELTAIKKASRKLQDWRLEDCTLYVTLEPCQMCAGAIVQARVKRVVIGCMNPKAGCAGSVLNILQMKEFNHQVDTTIGVMEKECSEVLKEFFKQLR